MDNDMPSSYQDSVARDRALNDLVHRLYERFGRMPTEQEVFGFIQGTDEDRKEIWNFGRPSKPKE